MTSPDLSAAPLPPHPAGLGTFWTEKEEWAIREFARLAVAEDGKQRLAYAHWYKETSYPSAPTVLSLPSLNFAVYDEHGNPADDRVDDHYYSVMVSRIHAAVAEATKVLSIALHASAPEGHKCADCTMDNEPCPTCYHAWWSKRHPHTKQIGGFEPATTKVPPVPHDKELEYLLLLLADLPVGETGPWSPRLHDLVQALRAEAAERRVAELEAPPTYTPLTGHVITLEEGTANMMGAITDLQQQLKAAERERDKLRAKLAHATPDAI